MFHLRNFCIAVLIVLACSIGRLGASPGDKDPIYRDCVDQCGKTGCVKDRCFPNCKGLSDDVSIDGPWYMKEPLYLRWKQWDCQSDCRYYCMLSREKERETLDDGPVKYHGKWPFKRVYGIQEPVSVGLSALNLAMHFHGWLSFFIVLYYKLPLNPKKKTCYEYTTLWHFYGLFSMNSWFWSAVFHSRDVDLTEKLDYSSAVALLGFSLIVAILRCFNVRDEAGRVMVSAPIIAFVTTHILYLNFYKFDYGWNMMVCVAMGITQLLMWGIWAGISRHPSRWKVWTVVVGGGLAMLLEIYDFPPYEGLVDAHALWHATTIPLTYFWWSFIKDDAEFRTSILVAKNFEECSTSRWVKLFTNSSSETSRLRFCCLVWVMPGKLQYCTNCTMEQLDHQIFQRSVLYKNVKFTVCEVGVQGRPPLSSLDRWRGVFHDTQALIFVVDSTDVERIGHAKEDIQYLINNPTMPNCYVLVFANKQDVKGAMTPKEVCDALGLDDIKSHKWRIEGTCALKGDGLYEGLDWLIESFNDLKA